MNLDQLHHIARLQHGAIGHHQLLQMGIDHRKAKHLVDNGVLVPVDDGHHVVLGSPNTIEQRISLATLVGSGRSIASHRTAAFLWDALGPDHPWAIDVIMPGRSHHRSHQKIVVHSPRDHRNIAPIRRRNIRVTTATRTLIDLAAVNESLLKIAAERMLLAGHIRKDRLVAAVAQHSARGRRGIGPIRDLLRTWPYGDKVAESVFELRMHDLLHGTVFTEYETQVEIGPYRVDLAWLRWKVILECDGWGKVDSAEHMRKWARRDSFLQTQGWLVVHVTWAEITRSPGLVIGEVRRALTSRGWTPTW